MCQVPHEAARQRSAEVQSRSFISRLLFLVVVRIQPASSQGAGLAGPPPLSITRTRRLEAPACTHAPGRAINLPRNCAPTPLGDGGVGKEDLSSRFRLPSCDRAVRDGYVAHGAVRTSY